MLSIAPNVQAQTNPASAMTTEARPDVVPTAIEVELQPYAAIDYLGNVVIDVDQASRDGVSTDALEVATLYNEIIDSNKAIYRSWYDPTTWPRYGNWCGKGHGGSGDPVDAIDAACKRHDECYAQYGFDDCGCDLNLRNEVDRAHYAPRVGKPGQMFAEAMFFGAGSQSCTWHLG